MILYAYIYMYMYIYMFAVVFAHITSKVSGILSHSRKLLLFLKDYFA